MYQYTWYQWLFIFYLYCFLGWIFESSYVSLKERRPVNRGFLRLPLLPLYGTGAVMMLWVSLPLREHLLLVFLAGMTASTALEYITGWCMEQLFRVRLPRTTITSRAITCWKWTSLPTVPMLAHIMGWHVTCMPT